MYLNSKSYKKYKKYKSKYQILKNGGDGIKKNILNGGDGIKNILNGGDCNPLPNPEEDDNISGQNLLDLCSDERITIQNKCYEVNSLYEWMINLNNDRLPDTRRFITDKERKKLIKAYNKLFSNIITRNTLIQLYPDLNTEDFIELNQKNYTGIELDAFNDLQELNSAPNIKASKLE